MGRQLKFDRDKALQKATALFWKRGYVNTSLAQLTKAMRLGEGSFYNTFKSKKLLFLECLKHYTSTMMARRSQAIASEAPAKQRITEFFDVVVEDLASRKPVGCLVSNSLNDEVLGERELRRYLFDRLEAFVSYLADIVADGQKAGEFSSALAAPQAARVIFTYLHGLNRLSVFEFDADARRTETRAFLDSLLVPAARSSVGRACL